jgi:mRNA-degrading endonuclease RelE of RelBE toxin-antitoxin system
VIWNATDLSLLHRTGCFHERLQPSLHQTAHRLTDQKAMTIIMVMGKKRPFALTYDPEVEQHLRSIEKKHYSLIHQALEEQLRFEPETETRNRKPLEQPAAFGATWELRFGPANQFRVLYAVVLEGQEVQILAIGVKDRNRLIVGGEEVEL